MLTFCLVVLATLKARLADARSDERGAVTVEQVVTTALYAAGAIAITGIIVAAATGKAGEIADLIGGS